MTKDITKTQFFKIFTVLKKHEDLTAPQVADLTGLPEMSVRTILSSLSRTGNVESKHIYRLKK